MNAPVRTALTLALLAGCKTPGTPAPASATLTDETRRSLKLVCRDLEPDGDREERLAKACQCLQGRKDDPALGPLVRAFCDDGGGRAYFDRIAAAAKAEGVLVITATDGHAPSEDDRRCADGLAEVRVEGALDAVADACAKGDADVLRSLLTIPAAAPAGACWRFVRMNADGCVVVRPCVGRGDARVSALPFKDPPPGPATRKEGEDVVLCQREIQTMHQLKDPQQANLNYNYPFAAYLSMNRSTANVTYGAANCHGTAQALSGDFLAKLPVTKVAYHSDEVRRTCGDAAQAAYDAAKTRAADAGQDFPTGDLLPVARGGYVVNMIHDKGCDARACGEVSFSTFSCRGDGGRDLESHVFVNGMCINCWGRMLEDAGMRKLPASATWRDLVPGCVLTVTDHSVTLAYQNDGFCYFYESLSPFAPPQMNVTECPSFFRHFPGRWCPAAPRLGFAPP